MSGGNLRRRLAGALVVGLAALVPSLAAAQVYRCSNGGATYISDRPCSGVPAGKLGVVGPTERNREAPSSSYVAPVGLAPEHQAFMNSECASLSDAIRTGAARGLKSQTIEDVRREYRNKCSEEDQAARQRMNQAKTAERNDRKSQQMAEEARQNAAATSRAQCDELLRILAGKRRQADGMNAGEKADFQRFEANYNSRCKG